MHINRRWLAWVLACAAPGLIQPATAAALGAEGLAAVIGRPLDFSVQVRLAAGESLTPECVSAQVSLGDRVLPPGAVRVAIQALSPDMARLRVTTTLAVDEPVVGVLVKTGCNASLTRRFVLLADPPELPAMAATAEALSSSPLAAAPTPPLPTPVAGAGVTPGAPAPDRPAPAQVSRPADSPVPIAAAGPGVAPSGGDRPSLPPRRKARPAAVRQAAVPGRTAEAAEGARRPTGARLQLDLAEPEPVPRAAPPAALAKPAADAVEQALAAVAQAASAAREAARAASASAQRALALEETVSRLQAEAQRNDSLSLQLRQRLQRAEGGGRSNGLLLAVTGVLALLSGWIGWQLAALQQRRQGDWRQAAGDAAAQAAVPAAAAGRQPTAPIPFVTSEIRLPQANPLEAAPRAPAGGPSRARADASPALAQPAAPRPFLAQPTGAPRGRPQSSRPQDDPATIAAEPHPEPPMQRTAVLPRPPAEAMPRDVSIDELIDLEQQADFFVVLGQDEAAIDLLVEHIRNTGGGSPLPYLKLLEICRRRDDRSGYERMRSRFNHRFNAYAPEWGVDLQAGRSLVDYPGVIPRLEQVWPRPLDGMAELEALLFRKSRGDLFELPAYREVLLLYAIARDLLDREAGERGHVDLLLPLTMQGDFSSTAPAPYLELGQVIGGDHDWPDGMDGSDDRPTAPVDLDLTAEDEPQSSIFTAAGDPKAPPYRS